MQIRISADAAKVIKAMSQKGGLYPQFEERSASQIGTALITDSPAFIAAKKQIESEQHPRPGASKR